MDLTDEEVYTKHAEELLRFAATLVGPSNAEDLLSSAMLRVLASQSWSTVTHHRAYLYRAVLNEARQLGRSTQRRMIREMRSSTERVSNDSYVRPEVLSAVSKLSIEQRSVVFLTYWCDLGIAEVSDSLGMSRRTIERRLRSARTILRRELT